MSAFLGLRVALLIAGIALFAIAARTGEDLYRFIAIGLLAVAVILRFVGRRRPPPGGPPAG